MTDEGWRPSGAPGGADLEAVATRLTEERPVPSASLRSTIRSGLLEGGGAERSPSRVGSLVFGYATAGAVLLLIAAAGLAGVGPFAA